MPDIFDLIAKWWKQILAFVIIALVVTAIVVYTTPKKYLGQATALPAPTYATDKAGVFSENLQILYPGLGTSDDLDMILGTAHLDTVYTAVAAELNLADYFGIDKADIERNKKAGSVLKEKTRVIKSDYGDLKVKVWDGDKHRAAEMANGVMDKLQQIQQDVQTANNAAMLEKIKEGYSGKVLEYQKLHDSLSHMDVNAATAQLLTARQNSLVQQVQEYEKLLNQYQLMVNAKPHALIIVEKASPALWPDKPKPKETLLAAAVLSLLFGLFAALVLERRRMIRK
jgi:uncharacterized protein involved in exopolysaccharide biosynthesis